MIDPFCRYRYYLRLYLSNDTKVIFKITIYVSVVKYMNTVGVEVSKDGVQVAVSYPGDRMVVRIHSGERYILSHDNEN